MASVDTSVKSFLAEIPQHIKKWVIRELSEAFEKKDIITSDFEEPRCGCGISEIQWRMWKLPDRGKAEHRPEGWKLKKDTAHRITFVAECTKCGSTHTWGKWR